MRPGLLDDVDFHVGSSFRVVLCEFVLCNQSVCALDVAAISRIFICLDKLKVFLWICNTFQIFVPRLLNKFEVALYAFLHAVVYSEIVLDRCQSPWRIFLLRLHVHALALPGCPAFHSEVVMILGCQLALSPSGFQDCLGDDGTVYQDSVCSRVLLHVLSYVFDESLLFLCDCHLAYLLNKKGQPGGRPGCFVLLIPPNRRIQCLRSR